MVSVSFWGRRWTCLSNVRSPNAFLNDELASSQETIKPLLAGYYSGGVVNCLQSEKSENNRIRDYIALNVAKSSAPRTIAAQLPFVEAYVFVLLTYIMLRSPSKQVKRKVKGSETPNEFEKITPSEWFVDGSHVEAGDGVFFNHSCHPNLIYTERALYVREQKKCCTVIGVAFMYV